MVTAAVGRSDEQQYITEEYISELEAEMMKAAEELEFERAAALRDRIEKMRSSIGKPTASVPEREPKTAGRRRGRKGGREVPRPKRMER